MLAEKLFGTPLRGRTHPDWGSGRRPRDSPSPPFYLRRSGFGHREEEVEGGKEFTRPTVFYGTEQEQIIYKPQQTGPRSRHLMRQKFQDPPRIITGPGGSKIRKKVGVLRASACWLVCARQGLPRPHYIHICGLFHVATNLDFWHSRAQRRNDQDKP